MDNNYYPFINTPLPYAYNAMEPFIDEKTMQIHHDRHLQTYIDNLNATLKDHPQLQRLSLEQLLRNTGRLPRKLETSIRNNAGGVFNHRFFFEGLTNPSGQHPVGYLAQAIDAQFGGYDTFQELFKNTALSVFGSGYVWLVHSNGRLKIAVKSNQNTPIEQGLFPIFAIDVWEHAYYLKHQNVRKGYIEDWMQLIHWEQAEKQFTSCRKIRYS